MAAVRNLKILKGVLYADVTVAPMNNGGWVDMSVKVGRGEDEAVQAALTQLNEAIVAIAERNLGEVKANAFTEKQLAQAMVVERQRHAAALDTQRRSLKTDSARRLRRLADRFMREPEVRRALTDAASEEEAMAS